MSKIFLDEYFGQSVVISLKRCPEKLRAFRGRARAAGVKGVRAVPAVDGALVPAPGWWGGAKVKGSSGSWGCLLSHMKVAQQAICDGASSLLVFEDDCVFSPDVAEVLPGVMKALGDDWDMLYLGGEYWLRGGNPVRDHRHGNLLSAYSVVRTHAFAINGSFLPRYHQHVSHYSDYGKGGCGFHIDHQLARLHARKKARVFAIHPWLCGQAENSSEIFGVKYPELWWPIKDRYILPTSGGLIVDPAVRQESGSGKAPGVKGSFKGEEGFDPFDRSSV
jgi:hypothetical protein